ncbi:MAG: nucleotidyltransferase domain-containing protein, partial [Pseudomonadota bacterium]
MRTPEIEQTPGHISPTLPESSTPIILGPLGLPSRAALLAACRDAAERATTDQRRAAVVGVLKEALRTGRDVISRTLVAHPFSGTSVAKAYSDLTETVVAAALDAAQDILHPLPFPTDAERLAVLAVGGFGRGHMAPFSDVDLLFLTPWKQTAWGESLIESVLYTLWDLKLKVGQSVRTVEECLRLGDEDITIRTAMLERKHIWGDAGLSAELDSGSG